jgi:hypothetical protein
MEIRVVQGPRHFNTGRLFEYMKDLLRNKTVMKNMLKCIG